MAPGVSSSDPERRCRAFAVTRSAAAVATVADMNAAGIRSASMIRIAGLASTRTGEDDFFTEIGPILTLFYNCIMSISKLTSQTLRIALEVSFLN